MHNLRAPLNELKKRQNLVWTSERREVFVKIKEVLKSDFFLTHYNPDLDIIVASDTSLYGIGACILHKMTDGSHKPVVHPSRTFLPAEKTTPKLRRSR